MTTHRGRRARGAPRVSVVMAVYNGAGYVREAIDSVLGQTLEDLEFVIVDDCSTDATRDIVRSYDDPRVVFVENTSNCGQTRSLNRGLRLAAAELIARQDADDISEPARLARQVTFLEAHREIAMLGTWYRKIDAAGNVLGHRSLPCEPTDLRWCLLFFTPFVHSSVMFRRSVLAEVGLYNEALIYAQDHELWSRIAAVKPVANLAEPLVRFRVHPASMTETHGDIVERESRMRVLNMARVLGWPGADGNGEPDRRFHAMRSLLFETDVVVDPERLPSAVKDIEELTVNFLRRYALDARRSRAHRAAVRRRVSQRLVRAAAACARGDDWAKAWGLVLLGGRLRWHTVFQRRLWLAGEPCQHEPARVPRIVRPAIHARA